MYGMEMSFDEKATGNFLYLREHRAASGSRSMLVMWRHLVRHTALFVHLLHCEHSHEGWLEVKATGLATLPRIRNSHRLIEDHVLAP